MFSLEFNWLLVYLDQADHADRPTEFLNILQKKKKNFMLVKNYARQPDEPVWAGFNKTVKEND